MTPAVMRIILTMTPATPVGARYGFAPALVRPLCGCRTATSAPCGAAPLIDDDSTWTTVPQAQPPTRRRWSARTPPGRPVAPTADPGRTDPGRSPAPSGAPAPRHPAAAEHEEITA